MTVNNGAQLARDELREFAAELTRLLAIRGISQAELADIVEVSGSAVTNWTHARSQPTLANIEAVEGVLRVGRGHLAHLAGYATSAEQPPPAQTLAEFLEREGLLDELQREVIISVHDAFLRVPPRAPLRKKGEPRSRPRGE